MSMHERHESTEFRLRFCCELIDRSELIENLEMLDLLAIACNEAKQQSAIQL